MNRLTKLALTGSAALVLMGGGFAVAQRAHEGGWHQRPSAETMGRMIDGDLAFAKTALKLSADQEKLWGGVEQAVRDNAAERQKLMAEREAQRPARAAAGTATPGDAASPKEARNQRPRPDVLKMLEGRSAMATLEARQTTKLLDALKPLYATLSDEQKTVLPMALHRVASLGGGGHHHRG